MTTSAAKIAANRNNSAKSTGPLTVVGKRAVGRNAIRHGIFAKELVLPHEDPEAYQDLLSQLGEELQPQGAIEQVLVERIAVAIWRQKRLIRAEAAYLAEEQDEQKIASAVTHYLRFSHSVSTAELSGIGNDVESWCTEMLDEIQGIGPVTWPGIDDFKTSSPLLFAYVSQQAESQQQSLDDYLTANDSPRVYLRELARYCRRQLRVVGRNAVVLEVAEIVKGQRAILKENLRDSLARYQMVLDNQLYKAVKMLMDLRLSSL